jgi:hypothetical protein
VALGPVDVAFGCDGWLDPAPWAAGAGLLLALAGPAACAADTAATRTATRSRRPARRPAGRPARWRRGLGLRRWWLRRPCRRAVGWPGCWVAGLLGGRAVGWPGCVGHLGMGPPPGPVGLGPWCGPVGVWARGAVGHAGWPELTAVRWAPVNCGLGRSWDSRPASVSAPRGHSLEWGVGCEDAGAGCGRGCGGPAGRIGWLRGRGVTATSGGCGPVRVATCAGRRGPRPASCRRRPVAQRTWGSPVGAGGQPDGVGRWRSTAAPAVGAAAGPGSGFGRRSLSLCVAAWSWVFSAE